MTNVRRQARREGFVCAGHSPQDPSGSAVEIELLHDEGELKELLLALPERQRLAIFLRYYADLSYAQIGEALGVKPGTVAASLNAARGILRRQLREVRT